MNFSTFKRLKVFSFIKSFKAGYNRTRFTIQNSRYCCQAPESTCGFIWVSWKKNLKSNLLVVNSYLNWYILTKTRLMRTYIIVVSNWRLRLEGQVWNIPLISPCISHFYIYISFIKSRNYTRDGLRGKDWLIKNVN